MERGVAAVPYGAGVTAFWGSTLSPTWYRTSGEPDIVSHHRALFLPVQFEPGRWRPTGMNDRVQRVRPRDRPAEVIPAASATIAHAAAAPATTRRSDPALQQVRVAAAFDDFPWCRTTIRSASTMVDSRWAMTRLV